MNPCVYFWFVIPAQAGIHVLMYIAGNPMDSHLRGNDEMRDKN